MANLINFGIIPLTFKNPDDFEKIAEGDDIEILGFAGGIAEKEELTLVDKTNGAEVTLVLAATARQREILLAGGLLNYTKDKEN